MILGGGGRRLVVAIGRQLPAVSHGPADGWRTNAFWAAPTARRFRADDGARVPSGRGGGRGGDEVERLRTLIEGPDERVGGGTLTTTQKVVEGAKSASFGVVGLGFLAVGAGLVYLVASHLLGASSPGKVFSKTCSLIKSDPRVLEAIGDDVRCYGEGTRGKDLDSTTYVNPKDKREHLRLRFYAEGSKENAEVICDIYASSGQYASVTVHVPYTGARLALTADGTFRVVN